MESSTIPFAELGQGPIVLLIHGLPDFWYPWRYHMAHLAARGYRAVVPDSRVYDDTTGAPIDPSELSMSQVVGDLILLLNAISPYEEVVFVNGHGWGASVALNLCLTGARTFVNMTWDTIPSEQLGSYGDNHYIREFQDQDYIEAEFTEVSSEEALTAAAAGLGTNPINPLLLEFEWMNEDYWPANNTINIHGIPGNVCKEDLVNYLSTFGVITHFECNWFGVDDFGNCTVKYETAEYKNAAMETLYTAPGMDWPEMTFHDAAVLHLCETCRYAR
ncbi:hypothetical protein CASFOL_005068 [Castilleja foliolosa]|uniref:AB hydrolase-1 domain-containing protein n=1 Tax=Castilleja foliolosa TaxID=1961234 RepID=A0ABD3E2C4_9LAMI